MSTLQTERQAAGNYRLDVKDFGPIARASIELRPLTVLIGPSNTGKSYLAILIYALHRCFAGRSAGTFQASRQMLDLAGWDSYSLTPSVEKKLKEWLSMAFQTDTLPPIPAEVMSQVLSVLEQAEGPDKELNGEIGRCFGVGHPSVLIRHSGSPTRTRSSAKIKLDIPWRTNVGRTRYELQLKKSGVELSGKFGDIEDLATKVAQFPDLDGPFFWMRERMKSLGTQDSIETSDLSSLFTRLVEVLLRFLLMPLRRPAYYLPADRTGVMHSHQVVVSTLVQGATTARLRPSDADPLLSGVLADFLSQLIEMGSEQVLARQNSSDLTERLETNILGGAVRLETKTGHPYFAYRPTGWKADLPLMRASSMVSELVPVVLYLRYLVRPGDVLIIEEPESHLHPAMQAVFARELARLVRSGIRVVVTTHSEWLLDQFANLVRLSELPEDKRKEFPGADAALRPEQFGAWLFKPKQRPKGSVVEEIRVDPDAGGLLADYSDIAEQLYNEWARIGNRIEEERGQ